MPPKPKSNVEQTVSNANKSYYRVLDSASRNCEKFHEISDVLGHSLHMAVVFTTRDGFVRYVGSKHLVRTISEKCEQDLLEASFWDKENQDHDTTDRTNLPRLPQPCSKLDSKSLQNIIPKVMRGLNGGGYVKWDSQNCKPVWWPKHVKYGNIKQRPVDQDPAIPWVECLREILLSLYAHYGQDAETYTEESETEIQYQCETEQITVAETASNAAADTETAAHAAADAEIACNVANDNETDSNVAETSVSNKESQLTGSEDLSIYEASTMILNEHVCSFDEKSLRTSTPKKHHNWREDEDDPCVRDYIHGYLSPSLKNNKRARGPPRCFTPSDWK